MTYTAKHPAAFINAIADEGTKAEAVEWLQRTWDDLVDAQAAEAQRGEPLPPCDPTATQCPRCNNPNGPVLGPCEAQRGEPVAECKDDGEGGVYYVTLSNRAPIGLLYAAIGEKK